MIRTLWATAAVLAIFAMHGVMAHAAAAEPDSASTAVAATTLSGHLGGLDDAGAIGSAVTSAAPAHGEHGHDVSVLALCAAVLATAAIMLLAGLQRPRSGLLSVLPRPLTTTSYAVGARSTHAPPDLHALSVLRC